MDVGGWQKGGNPTPLYAVLRSSAHTCIPTWLDSLPGSTSECGSALSAESANIEIYILLQGVAGAD